MSYLENVTHLLEAFKKILLLYNHNVIHARLGVTVQSILIYPTVGRTNNIRNQRVETIWDHFWGYQQLLATLMSTRLGFRPTMRFEIGDLKILGLPRNAQNNPSPSP